MRPAREQHDAPTILVVDDQPGMRWVLSKVLRDAHYTVKTAETAAQALATARNGDIAAAIIDYRLPDESGMQLFRELRKARLSLRAILITSYGSPQLREQALALGFHAYFDKPLDVAALVAALNEALREPSHEKPD